MDCGVISDPRLFPLSCHTFKKTVHPLQAVPFHKGSQASHHPSKDLTRKHSARCLQVKETEPLLYYVFLRPRGYTCLWLFSSDHGNRNEVECPMLHSCCLR